MDKTAIGNELRKAGAETVGFQDSFDHLIGIGVTIGDKRHAVAWGESADKSAEAVEQLKKWLQENARSR